MPIDAKNTGEQKTIEKRDHHDDLHLNNQYYRVSLPHGETKYNFILLLDPFTGGC